MRVLVGIPISPWTEKARWALDHHALAYRFEVHFPVVNEVVLRLRRRDLRGPVTAPMLLAGDCVARDSYAIAQYAERHGRGEPLLTDGAACEELESVSQALCHTGRALLITRLAVDPDARAAGMPPIIPEGLRGVLDPVAKATVQLLARKYRTSEATTFEHELSLRRMLEGVRARLGGRSYLVGDHFSYGDLAVASAFQLFAPVADAHVPLPAAIRRAVTYPEIARSFADLVEWREALYARHRGKTAELAA
mgnify:CR=1 FL=1